MNLLLDTHVLLWWLGNSLQLPVNHRKLIGNPDNIVYVSAATIWEIEIKTKLGKLKIPSEYLNEIEKEGFIELPVTWLHSRGVSELPLIHRDPFDRLLIAQARAENLTLLSVDEFIGQYDVEVL
jgi:PIN domain nuclease of toxin-antitoxin system